MNKIKSLLATAALTTVLAACSSSQASSPDLGKALDRTSKALTIFQNHLQSQNVEKVTDKHLAQMADYMRKYLNVEPPVYKEPLGVKVLKDSTFVSFNDPNKNNVQDAGEKQLFKIQIDFEGKRLIASEIKNGGHSVGMGMGTGFLAGMLMGRLMNGQRAAGVQPGSLANKKAMSRSSYSQMRSRTASRSSSRRRSSSRSRARSGGYFGGK